MGGVFFFCNGVFREKLLPDGESMWEMSQHQRPREEVGNKSARLPPRLSSAAVGLTPVGVPTWVLAGSSPPWDSMGRVLIVLLSTQLRLMSPAGTGWTFQMGTFVCLGLLLLLASCCYTDSWLLEKVK